MAKKPGMKFTMRGFASYPHLVRPDTQFDPEGKYVANLAMDADAAAPWISKFTKLWKEMFNQDINPDDNPIWKWELEDDKKTRTGRVVFKISCKNKKMPDGSVWDRRPKQFDSKNNEIVHVDVFGGTEMQVAGEVYPWRSGKTGFSLQPLAIQIINLVKREDAGASVFEEVEGYVFDDGDAAEITAATTTTKAEESDSTYDF